MIEIKNISKTYNGKVKAVNHLNMTVEDGEIIGFIGQMERVKQRH